MIPLYAIHIISVLFVIGSSEAYRTHENGHSI